MRKIMCTICETGYHIAETMIFIMILSVVFIKIILPLFGLNPLICISDSMYPAFAENSLCFVDYSYELDNIKTGDIIAFKLDNDSNVTHRVMDVIGEGFVTKGDANESMDAAIVRKDQVIGINKYQIPGIGIFFRGFPNKALLMLIAPTVMSLIAFRLLGDVFKKGEI